MVGCARRLTGPCTAGFFCPEGANSSQAYVSSCPRCFTITLCPCLLCVSYRPAKCSRPPGPHVRCPPPPCNLCSLPGRCTRCSRSAPHVVLLRCMHFAADSSPPHTHTLTHSPPLCSPCRFACGGNASVGDAAAHYCPEGSPVAVEVPQGSYSTGSPVDAPHRRTGQQQCEPGFRCALGVKVSRCASVRPCVCVLRHPLHNSTLKSPILLHLLPM